MLRPRKRDCQAQKGCAIMSIRSINKGRYAFQQHESTVFVAAGLAFCAFVCLVVGSWSDVYEAIERRRVCRLSKKENSDYADEELYQ